MADEENALSGEETAETLEEQITPEATPEEITEEAPTEDQAQPQDAEPQIDPNAAILEKLEKLERRQGYLQRQLERPPMPPPQQAPPAPETLPAQAPREADFDSYDDYRDALEDFKINQAITQLKTDMSQQQRTADLGSFIGNLQRQGSEKYADFAEITQDPTLPITTPMVEMLREFEHPADIAYYLGKNPVQCSKIAQMSPVQAARELSKIEGKVSSATNAQQQPKTITKAPPPIAPNKTGGETVTKDPSKMSQAEYEEWRRAQGFKQF